MMHNNATIILCHFAYSGAININNNATQYNNISKINLTLISVLINRKIINPTLPLSPLTHTTLFTGQFSYLE
jgi:hypothetical protein